MLLPTAANQPVLRVGGCEVRRSGGAIAGGSLDRATPMRSNGRLLPIGLGDVLPTGKVWASGLELFTAVQGGLILAWATKTHLAIPLLGLSSCVAAYLWDARNRFMLRSVQPNRRCPLGRRWLGVSRWDRDRRGG